MQTVFGAMPSSASRPRRKPFTAIRKGLTEHVLSGRLRGTAFAVYVWLHMQADYRTGTVRSNAGRLAAELGLHPVTVRRDLGALRAGGYIRYASAPGSRQLYEIAIEKYERNFEGAGTPGAEQVLLQPPLQERLARARLHERVSLPKKIDGRRTASALRVRSADADPESGGASAGEAAAPGGLPGCLARDHALAAAPAILRETLELFFLKTGRAARVGARLRGAAPAAGGHTPPGGTGGRADAHGQPARRAEARPGPSAGAGSSGRGRPLIDPHPHQLLEQIARALKVAGP